MRRTGRAASEAASETATVVQRIAVLLAAGVAPANAWGYVAESVESPVASGIAASIGSSAAIEDAIAEGAGLADASDRPAWFTLAAAWSVATEAGAPLAPALRELASTLRAMAQVERDVVVALAAPASTARIVMFLPGVGVLFGALLGFDTFGTLLGTPLGLGCLVVGALLILAARRWNRRLVAAASTRDFTAGLEAELTAIAVSGGGSLDRALEVVGAQLARFELPASGAAHATLELSRRAGVPAAELLRSEAEEQRRGARSKAQLLAAALSVKLMLPLGLCILPAFMALGVVPLLVTVISSTVATF